ncbi:hypothetical protein ARMGADRAFT_1082643 [Armillaria gallica]|uniref:Uncharacterized protein n=1 Tax=Armillaria gallica TaxID=47427 RepID=A0A2H3D520_ARMGA|nr:hypothetical protein ARMGADRAFT_1082643 [Armillaria gallica]
MIDSDTDLDMPPLTSVSDSSESESDTDSKSDEDGVPGHSVFQLPPPEEMVQRDEGQGVSTSTYLPTDMPFETSLLPEIWEEPSTPGIVILSETMMTSKPSGIEMYIEDQELHQELVLRAAKASIMLLEYTDSIYSSETSKSESDEDDEEHAPLILNDLLQANIKNSHYAVEMPYEPYYYACRMSESNQYGANSTLSYLIRRHDDHQRHAWHFKILENGIIPSHIFHHVNNPLEYAVVDVFQEIRDNSPLELEDNSLLAAGNALYDELRGHDEWKIAMLGIKIYRLMCKMDMNWNHWVHGDAQPSPSELDQIQRQLFLAHDGWQVPKEFEDWKDKFITRDVSDSCAGRHIMKPDEEDMPEGLIPHGIVFA